ncbi:MAG: hypothetical protein HYV63_16375 [Candidatus Schekmanbacteria bacterium]|nr:hypothetical protein [Candidatus Schekmanbacteria bacterium]
MRVESSKPALPPVETEKAEAKTPAAAEPTIAESAGATDEVAMGDDAAAEGMSTSDAGFEDYDAGARGAESLFGRSGAGPVSSATSPSPGASFSARNLDPGALHALFTPAPATRAAEVVGVESSPPAVQSSSVTDRLFGFVRDSAEEFVDRAALMSAAVGDVVTHAGQSAGDTLQQAAETVRSSAEGLIEEVAGGAQAAVSEVISEVSEGVDAIRDAGGEALRVLDEVGTGVSELVDRARDGAQWVADRAGALVEALTPLESHRTAIANLNSDGDTFTVKVAGGVQVAPEEGLAVGVPAGVGISTNGEVQAQVKLVQDPQTGQRQYELEVSGDLRLGLSAELGQDGAASAEGHAQLAGNGRMTFRYDSPEAAASALEQLGLGRFPEGLQSIEVRGGTAGRIAGELGLEEVGGGGSAGLETRMDVGVRLELNPPGVVALAEGRAQIDGGLTAGATVRGQAQAGVKLETGVSLPPGTTIADVLRSPTQALSSIDRSALRTEATITLRQESGVGALGATLYGGGQQVELKATARPGEALAAAGALLDGDVPGAVNALSENNAIAYRHDVFTQRGPRISADFDVLGVGLSGGFEWFREDHETVVDRKLTAAEVLRAMQQIDASQLQH